MLLKWLRQMIPEYYTLAHPNAQIDNAIFWRDGNGIMECGLIESQSRLPRCFASVGGSGVFVCVCNRSNRRLVLITVNIRELECLSACVWFTSSVYSV